MGESPLNGNGAPLTGHAEGEDMVYSIWKHIGVLLTKIGDMMKKYINSFTVFMGTEVIQKINGMNS